MTDKEGYSQKRSTLRVIFKFEGHILSAVGATYASHVGHQQMPMDNAENQGEEVDDSIMG